MSRSLRRGALAATVLAFSIAALAGCGVGTNAQTLEVKPDNAATTVGVIKVQNALIITQPKLDAKGPAVISATLFNNGRTDQTLDSVTLPGSGATADLKPAKGKGPLTVPAGGSLLLGGKGNASAVLATGRESVQDGNVQPVTFTFSGTGQVKLDTFVVPAHSYFSKWGPSTLPQAPTGSPSPSGSQSGAPGAPSGSPSGSPSDGASGNPADPGTQGGTQNGGGTGTGDGTTGGAQNSPSSGGSPSTGA
ncbi:DUF461 domain-containing protein [Streptomyces sp. TS71-3]|uniref:DUF461 domain-containing protein n=1 Tax=Streptomyces sp. TS71-3 TaxID=2733862 RepID=UPI001B0C8C94|nr:DUF461 domain-containing protein [Streptomyces sp. TS71-3]GHJ34485.1 lipoprotein [Streptomyces sp. TS71-3]